MSTPNLSSINPARLEQIRDFLAGTRFKEAELHPLAGDASFRRYIRLHLNGESAMLMDAPPDKEDVRPYIAVAEYLSRHGYSAPVIHARHETGGLLLLEDLGDDSFTSVLKKCAAADKEVMEGELYAAAIDVLAEWHDAGRGFTKPEQLVLPTYNDTLLMKEVSLFTDWYLPQVMGKEKAALLAPEYLAIWTKILSHAGLSTSVWVHRDYHADNLMWLPDRDGTQSVGLLDFQDGVYGDAAYDMVSLLEDARRDVAPSLAAAMLTRYISATGVNGKDFRTAYAVLGAQRNCKIIGIFSRLAVRDNKFSYLNFLPRVWGHLECDLEHPAMAELKQWMDRHIARDQRGVIAVKQQLQTA